MKHGDKMNIFFISHNQGECAKALDNKRLIKAVLETAQLLSNSMHLRGIEGAPYKLTHVAHPCTKWVNTDSGFIWTKRYFHMLCEEYSIRYNKVHSCYQYLPLFNDVTDLCSHEEEWVDPPNVTTFKNEEDVCIAYKKYLLQKWDNDKRPPVWYYRQIPCWNVNGG